MIDRHIPRHVCLHDLVNCTFLSFLGQLYHQRKKPSRFYIVERLTQSRRPMFFFCHWPLSSGAPSSPTIGISARPAFATHAGTG